MSPFYHDDIPNASGIYRITCTITDKIYIGSAINLRMRRKSHFGYLQRNMHKNPKLQAAWNKYGEDAFTFEVLELVLPPSLTMREQYWFKKLRPFGKRGFNIALIAGSHLGMKRSPETGKRISAAKIGKPNGNLGKKHNPERIEHNRQINLGRRASVATKRKMGDAHRGTKRSLATREKQRLSALGHAPTNRVRPALVIAPDGTEYLVESLPAFCREHPEYHLKASNLGNAARGTRKQYKGWKAHYLD